MTSFAHSDHQFDFFDSSDPGEAGKQDGMDRAEQNANLDFQKAAEQAIYEHAKCNPRVTINVVWPVLEALGISTHENRASGPVMRSCAKKGWIRKTREVETTTRPTRRKGDVAVWESLICNKEAA